MQAGFAKRFELFEFLLAGVPLPLQISLIDFQVKGFFLQIASLVALFLHCLIVLDLIFAERFFACGNGLYTHDTWRKEFLELAETVCSNLRVKLKMVYVRGSFQGN